MGRSFMLDGTKPKYRSSTKTPTTAAAAAAAASAAASVGFLNGFVHRLLLLVILCGPVGNAFRESEQFDKGWCPSYCAGLNIASSNDLHPCSRRYVFVIAAGRSGSTTVMNMLNSLPGVFMSGENSGALKDLVQYWNHSVVEAMNHDGTRAVKHMHTMIKSNFDPNFRPVPMKTGPWRHDDIQSLRALPKLQELYTLTTGLGPAAAAPTAAAATAAEVAPEYVAGSKILSIRLGHVFDTVILASKLFPCSKFVWSVRRSYDEWYGSLQNLNFGIEKAEAKVLMQKMKASHLHLGTKQSFWFELETFNTEDEKVSTAAFNGLAQFLKYPAQECRFSSVLHSNGGKDGFGAVDKLPEVLASRRECTAKLKEQVASTANYFSKHAGGVGVDGATAAAMHRPLDWRCAPTCGNYYADSSNRGGTRRDHPELSVLFRWKELSTRQPGFKRGPVEPYLYLYQILPPVQTVVHTPVVQYWRKEKKKQKSNHIQTVDKATEIKLKDSSYNALIWGAIEAGAHANPWLAPCKVESTPHMLLPTLNPPIVHLKDMTLITIEPLYKIKGSQLCSKKVVDCSETCWAKMNSMTGHTPNMDCFNCQQSLFTPPETLEMCFLVNRNPRSMAVPYPTNFVTTNDYDTMLHIAAVSSSNRPELMTYASSDHGTFSLFRATLRKQCEQSHECTHYDCTNSVACKPRRCSICSASDVARRHLRAKFSLQPPGDSPSRQSIFDTLIQGSIPVFFSTCAQPDLLYETMYAPFLPVYARERFGAGSWAVVLDARKVFEDPLYVERSLIEIAAASKGKVLKKMQKTIKALIPRILYPKEDSDVALECVSSYTYAHYIYFDELVERGITTLEQLRESTDFWAKAYFRERSIRKSQDDDNAERTAMESIQRLSLTSSCGKFNATANNIGARAKTASYNSDPPSAGRKYMAPKYRSYRHKMQVLQAEAEAEAEAKKAKAN